MGKPTGFLEYGRALPEDRPALERISDWSEFHGKLPSDEERRRQAARCMDCGIPYCHSGILYNGAASGCPLHNLIPEWNDLVYRGLWRQAYRRLRMTNDFPEITGRVCPAPCEGACTVGINEPQVTIKEIEKNIADRAWDEGWVFPDPPPVRTGKKVAIVGSGPSGLACANQLNRVGHFVTVYERADRPGGLLMYGIPNMKLDKGTVERRVSNLRHEGVKVLAGLEVGKDIAASKLLAEYDAVVLACGATKPRDLPIPGRELGGIEFAVKFLSANTKSLLDSELKDGNYSSAKGKDVVIIGGGDTGTDCLGTSIRHGCSSVVQLEILPKPPAERAGDNPWPEWPRTLKTDYGQEEAAALYGADPRRFCVTAKEFLDSGEGRVSGILTVQVEWMGDTGGRFSPREIPGTEKMIPAQLVLLAMGFLGPEDTVLSELGVERDARSNAKAEYGKFSTSVPKVFAAGDMRRGQSLVVWAIDEGRKAAREVDKYLMGSSMIPY